jgi:uncharacterized protein YicC (UPF0701 family)
MRERLDAIACHHFAGTRNGCQRFVSALRSKLDATAWPISSSRLEPGRLEQEIVLSLQKIDVDEELDRLAAHVDEARRILGLKGGGRSASWTS